MWALENIVPVLDLTEKGVLLLLLGLSIWSIGIMIERRRVFRSMANVDEVGDVENLIVEGNESELSDWLNQNDGLIAKIIKAMVDVPSPSLENMEAAFRAFMQTRRLELERKLSVLATLGANAPFIGLFGTVLGIIEAFAVLSAEQSGSDAIMASIAEALLATAAGLFVAIPAVVAFNLFSARLRTVMQRCETIKNLYLSRQG